MVDAEVAIAAALAGADVVERRVGVAGQRFDKGGGDFATAVDVEAEERIVDILRDHRPDDAVLAEESGRTGAADSVREWLVDPLCGTLNHAVKTRVVAVNVALRRGQDVLCAAAADAFGAEVFWTDGVRAFRRAAGDDVPLTPSAASNLIDLNLDPPFPSAPAFRAVALAADPRFADRFRPRVVSSSLALTWVATGQRAAYVTDGRIRGSVHFCAGLAVCEAAGCLVSDLDGVSLDDRSVGAIVAADEETHSRLVGLVRSQR